MIRFLLVVFAVVVFACIALEVITGPDLWRWAFGAFAAWALSTIVADGVLFVNSRRSTDG